MNKEKRFMIILLTAFLVGSLAGCFFGKKKVDKINAYEDYIRWGTEIIARDPGPKEYKISQPVSELIVKEEDDDNLKYIGEFLITGYCDCPICQEEWVGTTALGIAPTEEWTIAVDPDVIPLGSFVWIDGNRYRAEDVGGAINDNHIDMFMGSHEDCYDDICNGYKDVYIEVAE